MVRSGQIRCPGYTLEETLTGRVHMHMKVRRETRADSEDFDLNIWVSASAP